MANYSGFPPTSVTMPSSAFGWPCFWQTLHLGVPWGSSWRTFSFPLPSLKCSCTNNPKISVFSSDRSPKVQIHIFNCRFTSKCSQGQDKSSSKNLPIHLAHLRLWCHHPSVAKAKNLGFWFFSSSHSSSTHLSPHLELPLHLSTFLIRATAAFSYQVFLLYPILHWLSQEIFCKTLTWHSLL